jgi:hypothetical protein
VDCKWVIHRRHSVGYPITDRDIFRAEARKGLGA